jgi:hypothetical protein
MNALLCHVTEFDFRYDTRKALGYTDVQRADWTLDWISGERTTYRRTESAQTA